MLWYMRFTATGIAPEFMTGIAPDSHFKHVHLSSAKIEILAEGCCNLMKKSGFV